MSQELARRAENAGQVALSGADVLRAWLDGRSQLTRQGYICDLGKFAAWVGAETAEAAVSWLLSLQPGEANRQVLSFVAQMKDGTLLNDRGETFSSAAINRRLAALRSMTKLARLLGLIDWHLEVENLKQEDTRNNSGPDLADVRLLQRAAIARGRGKAARRARAVLALLHDLVLRRGSVCRLDLADVELGPDGRPVALMVLEKGKRERRRLVLAEPTAQALLDWIQVRGDHEGALLHRLDGHRVDGKTRMSGETVRLILAKLGKCAGLKVRPHGLRHSGITTLMDSGVRPTDVQQLSGHASLDMLMRYYDRRRRRQVAGEVSAKLADLRTQDG
jgi:integrase